MSPTYLPQQSLTMYYKVQISTVTDVSSTEQTVDDAKTNHLRIQMKAIREKGLSRHRRDATSGASFFAVIAYLSSRGYRSSHPILSRPCRYQARQDLPPHVNCLRLGLSAYIPPSHTIFPLPRFCRMQQHALFSHPKKESVGWYAVSPAVRRKLGAFSRTDNSTVRTHGLRSRLRLLWRASATLATS